MIAAKEPSVAMKRNVSALFGLAVLASLFVMPPAPPAPMTQ